MAQPEAEQRVHPLLICEALGFAPQLLLDDLINIANHAVTTGVNGLEGFLEKWVDERSEGQGSEWTGTQEVELGLVAFQTLLEHYTDVAFDFFEAWATRNIFVIPPDLPIVLPHHKDLDLTHTAEEEQEILDQIDTLRKQLDNQRRLERMYTRALRVAKARRRDAERRYERLSILDNDVLDVYSALPNQVTTMYGTVSSLSPLDPTTAATLAQFRMTEPGKRLWETNKTGYLKWAVRQLWTRAGADGPSGVDEMTRQVKETGWTEDMKAAMFVEEDAS